MGLRDHQRVIYTSPIKALSNQKYSWFPFVHPIDIVIWKKNSPMWVWWLVMSPSIPMRPFSSWRLKFFVACYIVVVNYSKKYIESSMLMNASRLVGSFLMKFTIWEIKSVVLFGRKPSFYYLTKFVLCSYLLQFLMHVTLQVFDRHSEWGYRMDCKIAQTKDECHLYRIQTYSITTLPVSCWWRWYSIGCGW